MNPFDHLQLRFLGDDQKLPGMPHGFVGEQEYRAAENFRKIETFDGQVESLLGGFGGEGDRATVSSGRTVADRVEIPLPHAGGDAVAGAGPLDIDDHVGDLVLDSPSQSFQFQADPRSGGDGHGLQTADRGTSHGVDGGQFIFHLQADPTHLGQAPGHGLRGFRGRSDGITGEKIGTRQRWPPRQSPRRPERSIFPALLPKASAGLLSFGFSFFFLFSFLQRRWRNPGSAGRRGRIRCSPRSRTGLGETVPFLVHLVQRLIDFLRAVGDAESAALAKVFNDGDGHSGKSSFFNGQRAGPKTVYRIHPKGQKVNTKYG